MSFFDRFAERASHLASRSHFFTFCVVLVALWAPSLPLFGSVDTWQLVINTATTIITFLMVALLQNSQWRGDKATNEKLDAMAAGLADTMDALGDIMRKLDLTDRHHEMQSQSAALRHEVGVEHRISSNGKDS